MSRKSFNCERNFCPSTYSLLSFSIFHLQNTETLDFICMKIQCLLVTRYNLNSTSSLYNQASKLERSRKRKKRLILHTKDRLLIRFLSLSEERAFFFLFVKFVMQQFRFCNHVVVFKTKTRDSEIT